MSEPDSGIFLLSSPGSDELEVPDLEPPEYMKKSEEAEESLNLLFGLGDMEDIRKVNFDDEDDDA